MKFRAFFDTNVLVYEFDAGAGDKRERARSLLNDWRPSGSMVISTQILQELFVVLTSKLNPPMPVGAVKTLLKNYSALETVTVTTSIILHAVDIKERTNISFWDSLVVASAVKAHCKILFTEDLNHDQIIQGVRIINPFLDD